jgi:transcriptional regulator with XRE-family HTH domain
MQIGERLKEERERLGYNQTDFAALAAATRKTLFNWESGSASPGAEALAAWADHGLDVNYVVTGARDFVPPPALTAEEQTLLDYFRQASKEVRRAALGALLGAAGPAGGATQVFHGTVRGDLAGRDINKSKVKK